MTSCSYDQDDNLKAIPFLETQEAIAGDSDLFENLKDITTDDDRPDKSITCIDFTYPLTIFLFDENDAYLSTTLMEDDPQFSLFLSTVDPEYSISISFPITSTLESGEEFIIETKAELKEAIDNCLSIEIVGECSTLIRNCVWKVGYSFEGDNAYLGSIFQESDGFTTLTTADDLLNGSWSPFTIETELHINISINDTTAVGDYFNFDWKAEYIDENSLKLTHLDRELILNQRCDPDFSDCGNFNFEACETELDSGIAEFNLDDYTFCIFDTLELDEDNESLTIAYYETEEDALSMVNAINTEEEYTTSENDQMLYVIIYDIEHDIQYRVLITLTATTC